MTGTVDDDANTLYVSPSTLERLVAQERVKYYTEDGVVRSVFTLADPFHQGTPVKPSPDVMSNSVHRRMWGEAQNQHIFVYLSDV